jgi:hypothetical protein
MTPGVALGHTRYDGRKFHGPAKKRRDFRPGRLRGFDRAYLRQVDFEWPNARSDFIAASNIFKVLGAFFCNFGRVFPCHDPGASRSSPSSRRGEQLADSNFISCVFKALQPGKFSPRLPPARVRRRQFASRPGHPSALMRAAARYAPRRTPQVARESETVDRPSHGARRRSTRVRATRAPLGGPTLGRARPWTGSRKGR